MELRDWAEILLSSNTLENKLMFPNTLSDESPGPKKIWEIPSRPYGMDFQKRSKEERLPPLKSLEDPNKRATCLHRFAGHELLAIEIMAFALLAFPDSPKHFRMGIAQTIKDEQKHLKLYIKRLKELGVEFGQYPLYKHFWAHVKFFKDPIHYVSAMNLTFEMANLDFAPMYGKVFEQFGDHASKDLMNIILNDEIKHVSFGWNWLKKFKPEATNMWQAWIESQTLLLFPKRAKGKCFLEEPRIKAGISPDWIEELKKQ
ncbi:hypothetical protein AB751O23_AK_00210 [Chlamydiales bacterium SCGC AB-751-O23]|jgi:uncharacterized ferritin-like protein (DUF455 family)|nr:hypothetical protein AB751O23_AK_00210 [Chlamydiales bacterium SCGC AB-751-O23]